MWFRVALLIGSLSFPVTVQAQTWTACIDPRSGGPTADGFTALREAAEARKGSRFGYLSYEVRHSVQGPSSVPPPFQVMVIELMRAGVGPGGVRSDYTVPYDRLPTGAETCFDIIAKEGAPSLWHYWGPYFPLGSAVIPEDVRPGMEVLVAGYQPGRTIYRVYAYADTLGTREDNERLSQARADAVARELIRLGIRWDDIELHSRGESELARPTADEVAEPLNRRVYIYVRQRSEPDR